MTALHVAGGAGSIEARLDDLLTMARILQAAAAAVRDTHDVVTSPLLAAQLSDDGGHDFALGMVLRHELVALGSPFGALGAAEAHLDGLAGRLRAAVELYHHADSGVLHTVLGVLGHAVLGGWLAGFGDFGGAEHQFFDALPGLTDLTLAHLGLAQLAYALAVPDGQPVLHDLGPDETPQAQRPPRGLADLVAGVALRDHGRHGEISVSFVVGADGVRRAIVDLPGTKSWNPVPNRDVTSVGTDIRAMAGRSTSYEQGVLAAMSAAGVSRDDEVMLVGHSEGGIVAVNTARDAVRTGRFRVTHVVTAGSPIGRVAAGLPRSVQVLALENSADVVPETDAAANPARPDITTVTGREQHDSIGANHDLERSYEPIARAADRSPNTSITAFTDSARGFLDATSMRTLRYWITRDP